MPRSQASAIQSVGEDFVLVAMPEGESTPLLPFQAQAFLIAHTTPRKAGPRLQALRPNLLPRTGAALRSP